MFDCSFAAAHAQRLAMPKYDVKPAVDDRLATAISELVRPPQAVHLHRLRQQRLFRLKGVYRDVDGQFTVKAPIGKWKKMKVIGVYTTVLAAAQAYDRAVFKSLGKEARLNFPADYDKLVAESESAS